MSLSIENKIIKELKDPDILSVCMKKNWLETIYILRYSFTHFADTPLQYNPLRKDPKFARYFEMYETLNKLLRKEILLDEVNEKYFTDSIFYNEVVEIMRDKVKKRFEKLTQGISSHGILDQKLQKLLDKRIEQMVKKIESKRKLVVFKQKVKQKIKKALHKDKAPELDEALDDIERRHRDELERMQLGNLEARKQLDKLEPRLSNDDLDNLGV